jgi:hypothetical protein
VREHRGVTSGLPNPVNLYLPAKESSFAAISNLALKKKQIHLLVLGSTHKTEAMDEPVRQAKDQSVRETLAPARTRADKLMLALIERELERPGRAADHAADALRKFEFRASVSAAGPDATAVFDEHGFVVDTRCGDARSVCLCV